MKRRSLKNQLNFVVSSCFFPGRQKHSDKTQRIQTTDKIYSLQTASKMRSLANSLAEFLSQYPEVKYVRDITSHHISAFIKSREKFWKSKKTRAERMSQLRKLETMAKAVFSKSKIDFMSEIDRGELFTSPGAKKIRNKAMSEKDFHVLQDKLLSGRSKGRFIPSITYYTGTRLEEAVSLKGSDINIADSIIHLSNCKGGRKRDVFYGDDPNAIIFFTDLKQFLDDSPGWNDSVCGGLKKDSVSKLISRTLSALYKEGKISSNYQESKTGNHSIRKLYARRKLAKLCGVEEKELQTVPRSTLKKYWPQVQQLLGHGPHSREELFKTYIQI